jgi:hypothetical protein
MSNKANPSAREKLKDKELIKKYKLKKDPNLQLPLIITGLLLLAVVLWITRKNIDINLKDIIEILVGVSVAVIAYIQWRAARHEISIDKYYDRLDNANNRLEKLKDVDPVVLHVFAEMDKLEYVLMKYKIGFMPLDLVRRATDNFESLCKHRNNFHSGAKKFIGEAAYLPETQEVVNTILDECKPENNLSQIYSDKEEKM